MQDKWIIKIIKTLLLPLELEYAGEHRKQRWEAGWKQNLDEGSVVPRYFGKYPVIRKNGKFIEVGEGVEYKQLVKLEKKVFTKYLKKSEVIYEFGCGTGHNLLTLSSVNKHADLVGLDWVRSSVQSVERLGFEGNIFNMFHPAGFLDRGAVFTVAAMEQLGKHFYQFVDYLIQQKPTICVHLEPITELMNPDNLIDYLQLQYMKRRNYLSGFLTYLRQLEKERKIKILEASRNGMGSLFIEGYSLIVWKPRS